MYESCDTIEFSHKSSYSFLNEMQSDGYFFIKPRSKNSYDRLQRPDVLSDVETFETLNEAFNYSVPWWLIQAAQRLLKQTSIGTPKSQKLQAQSGPAGDKYEGPAEFR